MHKSIGYENIKCIGKHDLELGNLRVEVTPLDDRDMHSGLSRYMDVIILSHFVTMITRTLKYLTRKENRTRTRIKGIVTQCVGSRG
jgi:hypothetical protein